MNGDTAPDGRLGVDLEWLDDGLSALLEDEEDEKRRRPRSRTRRYRSRGKRHP